MAARKKAPKKVRGFVVSELGAGGVESDIHATEKAALDAAAAQVMTYGEEYVVYEVIPLYRCTRDNSITATKLNGIFPTDTE